MSRITSKTSKIIVTIAVILAGVFFATAQLSRFAVDASLAQWHDGATGYQQALAQQRATGKPVALYFHTDWCANCKKLREDVLASPIFKQYLNNIIAVKINPEKGYAEKKLADYYGVMGYPTFLMLNASTNRAKPVYRTHNITPKNFVDQCNQALML
ncbi:MAG: thioredoxin family protein [Gammaproteobacteria bacterium]|nr:thioredoxin family protein [Gammaproteobacteria bacterium]